MDRKKALALFLCGAILQIWIVCIIVYFLRNTGIIVNSTSPAGIIAIAVGGSSSALWGIICLTKYKKVTIKTIIKDFFDIKQKPGSYLTAFLFLFIDFLPVFFGGKLIIASWYTPFVIFLSSLLLGGIEEIPWRYFFQPALQEKHSYVPSTLITFIAWEIWHLPFIYLWDHIVISDIPSFSLGLLTNCFILSALFIRTKSLWICVMTHSMINVLTQITSDGSTAASVICKAVIIGLAIFLSSSAQKADKETPLHKTDLS
ncbi:MAG: CPBP family intramembrane metalloprotease [Oscillospiraceae bacterium]|nr:CPBP family intramembrane metalloprotease [Oscillospiraceae bacterium]